jgi:hypothetical protein
VDLEELFSNYYGKIKKMNEEITKLKANEGRE